MLRHALLGLAAVGLVAACSGDDSTTIDADAGGDAATVADAQGPCGSANIICKQGAPGKACAISATPPQCDAEAGVWSCPSDTILADQCGCVATGGIVPGDPCGSGGDAGGNDAGASDAASE